MFSSFSVNAHGLVTSATSGTPSSGTAMANILYVDANGNDITWSQGITYIRIPSIVDPELNEALNLPYIDLL